ncbi:MAG: hypothetical protein JJD92_09935 [Frankiaceae bacterium]|nr:hypothetical protein [Frankiaceae bacterium]
MALPPDVATRQRVDVRRLGVALLGLASVASLLAWVYGLGPFRTWFLLTGLPAAIALPSLGVVTRRRGPDGLRLALVAGAIGGIAGTIGYDVFRVPFVVSGLRLLAPIDSYGVLLLGADGSSSWTGFAGWAYHFSNGIGFGIAYACVALGRSWRWGVLWGLVLETATIVTPFADAYALRGKWDLIAIAYAAHLFYGAPLGIIVQRAVHSDRQRPLVLPAWVVLGGLLVVLLVWLRPGTVSPDDRAGRAVAPGPSAVVVAGRLHPEWSRVRPGQCVALLNRDKRPYPLPDGRTLPAGGRAELCLNGTGVHRVRLSDAPYSGGFVLIDDQS